MTGGTPGRVGQWPAYQAFTARDARPVSRDRWDTNVPAVPARPVSVTRHNSLIP